MSRFWLPYQLIAEAFCSRISRNTSANGKYASVNQRQAIPILTAEAVQK
jgi:hypothetical protein